MRRLKTLTRVMLAVLFVAAGFNHFVDPAFYVSIMPPYIPWQGGLVVVSGIAEILLGAGLLVPRLTKISAIGIMLLLIAVFPANIHMAANPDLFPKYAPILLILRLPVQILLILWAFWYTRRDAVRHAE